MAFLTKTRFKEAIECPDRMFYYGKKAEYVDNRADDDFLQELAKTGIQIGELAKSYFAGGMEIESLNSAQAIAETNKLLKAENIILYEAALSIGNMLVRVDILIKQGDVIELIEVKSKSFFEERELFTKNGINSGWKEYIYDITFQFYVASRLFPTYKLKGYLCLIDKKKDCTVDGLYQRFKLKKIDNRYKVEVNEEIDIGEPILSRIELTDTILKIIDGKEQIDDKIFSFPEYVNVLESAVLNDTRLNVAIGRHCKSCPYKATILNKEAGLKSGFEECWIEKAGFTVNQFTEPHVFELWNLHYKKLETLISAKRYFLKDIKQEDLKPKAQPKAASSRVLTTDERQWIQIERAINPDKGPYINKEGLKEEFNNLKFPLHFIDFEVAMNGIPYKKGLRPYHQFAFQFSHHILFEDGKLAHKGQWIETRIANDPNVDFVRKLREQLIEDNGSVLIYSQYENTILLHLYDVINSTKEPDKTELLVFIKSITWCERENEGWHGERAMIDMFNWVFNNYLSKHMKNSNSIKAVLPSIINESAYIQKKYNSEIYGTDEIPSLNFIKKKWLETDDKGLFLNPYNLLPPVFDGMDRQAIELLFEDDELASGGAAMCAYNLMQFMEMTEIERNAIIAALYKYCELDTLAMVIIYEGLKDLSA